ncbi:MAG: T9SS type A sorting domain-containing protein [Bacteroidales bacterium]|nr:T9SS type A sorting domain-containing protein [Bacteroidales bacterium]
MKRHILMKCSRHLKAMLAIALLFVVPQLVRANDYLERDKHYNAYSAGVDKVHFVIPVWAYGKGYDYYAYDQSYISYTVGSQETIIAYYHSDRYDENEKKDTKKGTAYLKLNIGQGSILVTSMANGVNHLVNDNGVWTEKLIVTQKEDDGCPQVTMLELDWYPPEALDKKNFSVKIVSKFRRSYTEGNAMTTTTTYSGFTGNQNIMTPQLYTPYIYQVSDNGPAGYGYAAIPFMLFNDPVSYTTKYDSREQTLSDRGGTLYVMTTDTVQEQFYATFKMWRNQNTEDVTTKRSIAVDIPPYHRIYDFAAREEMDSTGTFTGNNVLSWNIRNPQLKDIMDYDFFQIERALKPDFSDAKQIAIKQMVRDESGHYTYTDNDRSTWTGNAYAIDSMLNLSYTAPRCYIYNSEGRAVYSADFIMTTDKVKNPGIPIYYRIRRASASMWNWDNEFSQTDTLINSNFLAPLAETQEAYIKDADYEQNHKVHFNFKLDNKEVRYLIPPKSDFNISYKNGVPQYTTKVIATKDFFVSSSAKITIVDPDNNVIVNNEDIIDTKEYTVPLLSKVTITYDTDTENNKKHYFTVSSDTKVSFYTEGHGGYGWFVAYITGIKVESAGDASASDFITETVLNNIKDSLYNEIVAKYGSLKLGRCMWDRTANLVLQRTIEETGQTQEYVIPQDSIKRQPDGSWIASFTDVADKACSHYKYAVRIDQSKSDLRVQDSVSLQPIALTGPSLYFDEGALVRNFTATQGDATTAMKGGVLLRWETDTNNYDDFVLLRKEEGSTASPDTLVVSQQSSYFDRNAMPNKHYEYTVLARYNCNGKMTINSADAIGWRTPYGEISGAILMPDNTGMAGVTVNLQDSVGTVIRSITTDATGMYKFDSLQYIGSACEDPTVKVEYESNFSINQPETFTWIRVLDANGNVLRDWANLPGGTYTYKQGTVIEVKTTMTEISNTGTINTFKITQHSTLRLNYSRYRLNNISIGGIIMKPYITGGLDYEYDFYSTMTNNAPCECEEHAATSYVVVPTHQYGIFSFNNTSASTASIGMSPQNAVASGINFENTVSTRLTGRVLYKNSTIPVAGAMFLLNGDTVRRGNTPLTSGIDGNFEMTVTKSQPCKLQVFKPGHTFEGEGILRVESEKDTFALTKPLDGVRFYDETKVRLVGRVAGGNDQRDLPEAFGLGKNNLGDNVQLVLQLEGDNTAHFVHNPNDLSRDTIQQTIGDTHTLFEKKRIIVHPDPETGEFAVDLFPVKYKVVQATATGYATLFGSGQGSETFDLTNASLSKLSAVYSKADKRITVTEKDIQGNVIGVVGTYDMSNIENNLYDGDSVQYNAVYDRIYHTPMQVSLSQLVYGIKRDGLGEPTMEVSNIDPSLIGSVNLYEKQADGTVNYLLGYPVYNGGRKYQFVAEAYEDYYYNNDSQSGALDRVPLRGGSVTVHNGLHDSKENITFALDNQGTNQNIWLMVDNIDATNSGTTALRTLSISLEQEGNTVETNRYEAYIAGTVIQEKDLRSTEEDIVLLDIIRDPGGAGSSAWVEAGSTYSYSYREKYSWEVGVTIGIKYGLNVSMDVGMVSAPQGAGSYQGSTFTTSKQLNLPIPITHSWDWGYQYDYSITTTDRISTSSSSTPKGVGAMADVFFGTTISQVSGKAKTIAIIGDSLYRMRKPAIDAGMMKVLAQGEKDGKPYYLVTGQKIVLGSTLGNTFAYSQHYILNTLLPEIGLERQNLLMNFKNLQEAKDAANAQGDAVYWYHPEGIVGISDTLPDGYYTMVTPDDDRVYNDRVAALDNMLLKWISILYQNEKEKVVAISSPSKEIGTYSVSYGATMSHTDAYTASSNYNEMPQGGGLILYEAEKTGTQIGQSVLNNLINNLKDFWDSRNGSTFGQAAIDALYDYQHTEDDDGSDRMKTGQELGTVSNTSKFSFEFEPVFDFESDDRQSDTKTIKKSAGFNIVSDPDGDITVSCYRVEYSQWAEDSEFIRENASVPDDEDNLYGSYVFFTQTGATYCPHEEAERTNFYNKGTFIGNNTQWIVKPEMTADTYEITNVQPQNSAYFQVTLMNNSEVDAGVANQGHPMTLMLNGASNPNGAIVKVDGMPLTQGISYWVVPGKPITKTVRIQRGLVDDYENLQLMLYPSECMKTNTTMNLSVHFLPVSSDVNIAMPRPNWIMNTLSSHDSVGYYIPVDIDGFDIHHKNFDHIEFQYKLSTESEEMWVNQCSFYASDSLYNLATGNKAMIENGRIVPFRFYGERDPMEQRYDLRAVSFCRYGSGFVTKSSPVISGVKDTRPPRVFGEPEPVNAILGVGDNLMLRFNEPIAGNYLDEDNNFQIKGVTNATGITTAASVHFDGSDESYAISQVSRSLSNRSFTLDMLVKPSVTNKEQVFFEHGTDGNGVRFGLTADNRLMLGLGTLQIYSKPLETMLEFTRVCVTYNHENNEIRFFAGTQDVTDPNAIQLPAGATYDVSAPLVFGRGLDGNMLELRLWSKALTQEEVAATHLHYLTGYELELVAYYQMAEGQGTALADKAGGATLTLHGASWSLPKGISLAIAKDERVQLNGNLLGRSKVYDETLMLWFRPTSGTGDVFSAGRVNDSIGTLLRIVEGNLVLHSDKLVTSVGQITDNDWHHFVLAVNRTYNNVSAFVDGKMTASFNATELAGISGAMYFGGNGFEGNVDEFIIFEQALPKILIEEYGNHSPAGDEMGLMAYLPFEEQKQNANGVLELVFSPNDQRIFKDSNGNIIDKVVPLIVESNQSYMADKAVYAPVIGNALLTTLNFDWAFNQDELLINLKMQDREINKQTVVVTVRDVEDLNGNPMPSPVMWVAYVDRNSLIWENRTIELWQLYGEEYADDYNYYDMRIINNSGKRHQFTIESLPDWLTVNQQYGTIQPIDDYTVRFTYNTSLPVGEYTDMIYVTDENGLSEPLKVIFHVVAFCPWEEVDKGKYDNSMSVRGQVLIETEKGQEIDTNNEDVIAVFVGGELVGMTKNSFDNATNKSNVYLTVYGNKAMEGKQLSFKLWQASTGKVYTLTPSASLFYANNTLPGYAPETPIVLSANEGEVQRIDLQKGWNWISMNLFPWNARLNSMFTVAQGFKPGDLVKSPSEQQFAEFSLKNDSYAWEGTLKYPDYHYMYMVRANQYIPVDIEGKALTTSQRQLSLYNSWNSVPYLLDKPLPVREALADYFDKATVGDVIKSKDAVAVFTENGRWEGSLQTMYPGQGYLLRRLGKQAVTFTYYDTHSSKLTQSAQTLPENIVEFTNPDVGTNMTLIAKVKANEPITATSRVLAYVGNDLAGIMRPQMIDGDTLVLLTVSADKADQVSFRLEDSGEHIGSTRQMFAYVPDAHLGTLKEPIILDFTGENGVSVTPNPFSDHVEFHITVKLSEESSENSVNIRIYSTSGALVEEFDIMQPESEQTLIWNNCESLPSGLYNAVVNINGEISTIKLIKR